MVRFSKVFVLVVLLISLAISAQAQIWTDYCRLIGNLGEFDLNATVTKVGGEYIYTYSLYWAVGEENDVSTAFSVFNENYAMFYDAANNGVPAWTNPVWNNDDPAMNFEIKWLDGRMRVGNTVIFSFKSLAAPMEDIDVGCYVLDTGKYAEGQIIGMGSAVPEPGTVVAILTGLVGFVGISRRRK